MNNKLLIIDDEEVLIRNYKSYFGRKGYIVFISLTGEQGLELLREHDPDLMLLDLHLKDGIQGIEVLREAIAIKPNLKVAILTGFGQDEEVRNTCISLGAKVVLKKPLTLEALKEEVEKLKAL